MRCTIHSKLPRDRFLGGGDEDLRRRRVFASTSLLTLGWPIINEFNARFIHWYQCIRQTISRTNRGYWKYEKSWKDNDNIKLYVNASIYESTIRQNNLYNEQIHVFNEYNFFCSCFIFEAFHYAYKQIFILKFNLI